TQRNEALDRGVKRRDDPAGRSVLRDVAIAARPEDRADQLRAPVDAEGDDRKSRGLGAEPGDRLGAVGVRQVEIAEDDVGLRVLEQSDRLAARRGEPDDDQALALEQGADAELHDGMVLYREYAQDRSALVPHLGPAQQRERVRGALGERGLIRLVGWIVPCET